MESVFEVAVVGGGVHGLAAMAALGRLGVRRRVLLERFRIGHDRGSSHGRTRITRAAYGEERYVRLMRIAREEDWPRLERDAGGPLVEPCDGCFLGVGGRVFAGYSRAAAAAAAPGEIERLEVAEARRRFPQFRYEGVVGALHDRTAGVIRADDTIAALARLARAEGGQVREETPVRSLERRPAGIALATPAGTVRAERVIVAAGPWLPALLPELAGRLVPIRQTVAYFRMAGPRAPWRVGGLPVWAVLGDGENEFHYGLPERGDEGVKVARHETRGRADDPEAPADGAPDPAAVQHLERFARGLFAAPVAARLAVERCFYTLTASEDLVVAALPDDPRIVVGAACSGHGFKFAPLVGRALAGLAVHGRTGVPALDDPAFGIPAGGC